MVYDRYEELRAHILIGYIACKPKNKNKKLINRNFCTKLSSAIVFP